MADVLVADAGVAHSINDVPQLQRSVCQCVEVLYGLRHGTTAGQPVPGPASIPDASLSELGDTMTEKSSSGAPSLSEAMSTMPEMDDTGCYPFPILDGGTFLVMAQRAQGDMDWLLSESAALLHAAGFLEGNDVAELQDQFLATVA